MVLIALRACEIFQNKVKLKLTALVVGISAVLVIVFATVTKVLTRGGKVHLGLTVWISQSMVSVHGWPESVALGPTCSTIT